MVGPAWARQLTATGVWLVVLMLVTTGCSGPDPARNSGEPYLVSYAGADSQLAMLDQAESIEQLRDWARLGLASSLKLSRDQLTDAFYDTTPVRNPAFAELVDQPTGPGRGLFDGTTLHVLVPDGDPHRSRTIGLVLDQHRADAGSDPARVQIHRYRMRPELKRIELFAETPAPAEDIRASNGWHEARIDQPDGLGGFLATTSHLSRVETRGAEIWAGGWSWPDTPTGKITTADVAVLEQGYRQKTGPLPGFSLDPQPVSSLADLRATVPGLAPAVAEAVISGNWAGSGYSSAAELLDLVQDKLFQPGEPADASPGNGLPTDRTQLWALSNVLKDQPVSSQATYYGGLEGTEVGMTLFYTDLITKSWTTGTGSGVPSKAVPGFVPDPQVATPDSLCATEPPESSGRLWFGQSDTAFTFTPTAVDIGAQATRLFSRANGSSGAEVEPTYSSSRGLRWWDRHYDDIAGYEPQYDRLDQIMRWSGALEWLTSHGGAEIPAPMGGSPHDLHFADWYARHTELRERAPLTLVNPPSAHQESVLPTPSEATPSCGLLRIVGGVSLADGLARGDGQPSGTAALPPAARRAGPTDPATTHLDPANHSGRIERVTRDEHGQVSDRLDYDIQRGRDSTKVRVDGGDRGSIPFDGTTLQTGTKGREFSDEFQADGTEQTYRSSYDGVPVGTLSVRQPPSSGAQPQSDITLRPGQLSLLEKAVDQLRQRPQGLDGAPDVLSSYDEAPGRRIHRYVDGWVAVSDMAPDTSVASAKVTTPAGDRYVALVTPARLSEVDLSSYSEVRNGTTTAGDLSTIADTNPVYLADNASILGAEHARTLPVGIQSSTRVRFRIMQPGPVGATNVPKASGDRTWSLVGLDSFPRGSSNSGGPGGSPQDGSPGATGGGGGRYRPEPWRGPGGAIILIAVCPQPDREKPRQDQEACA